MGRWSFSPIVWWWIFTHMQCHFLKWFQLSLTNQIKLSNKVVKMLVTCVNMGFCSYCYQPIKVMDVNMYKYSKQSCQNLLALAMKRLWEWNILRKKRKDKIRDWNSVIILYQMNLPTLIGKRDSLLIWASAQSINNDIYWGAGSWVGFLYLWPSAHKYSNLGPPDIVGHDCSVQ